MIAGCKPDDNNSYKRCSECPLNNDTKECIEFRKKTGYKLFHMRELYGFNRR
jgi:hypothetical protein